VSSTLHSVGELVEGPSHPLDREYSQHEGVLSALTSEATALWRPLTNQRPVRHQRSADADMLDLDAIALSYRSTVVANLDLVGRWDRSRWREHVAGGTWWIAPFAVHQNRWVLGKPLRPGVSLNDPTLPVLLVGGSGVVTVSSSAATALPTFMFRACLRGGDHGWEPARAYWDAVDAELRSLHQALGGTSETLDAYRDVLFDDDLRRRNANRRSLPEQRQCWTEIFERLDPSPENEIFRDYALRCAGRNPSHMPTDSSSNLARSLAMVAFNALFREESVPVEGGIGRRSRVVPAPSSDLLEAAHRLCLGASGLDGAYTRTDPFSPLPIGGDGVSTLRKAARILQGNGPASWKRAPGWLCVDGMASAEPYSGDGHIMASELLEEEGHAEAAFEMLKGAAYWRANREQPDGDTLRLGAQLAQRQGWTELHDFLSELSAD